MRVPSPVHAFLITGLLHIGLALLIDAEPAAMPWYPAAVVTSKGFVFGSLALYYLFFAALYWLAGRRVLAGWLTQLHFFISLPFTVFMLFFAAATATAAQAWLPVLCALLFLSGVALGAVNVLGGALRTLLHGGNDGRAEPPGPYIE
jgi:hypothetical protein